MVVSFYDGGSKYFEPNISKDMKPGKVYFCFCNKYFQFSTVVAFAGHPNYGSSSKDLFLQQ